MNKTLKAVIWIVVAVLVIWAIVSAGGKSASSGPIKVGFIGPMTGDASAIGQNAQAAVQIATDEINAAGGVNGRQVEVVYEDGQCSGAPASSAASKLINVDKVSVILGGACSGETMAFAKAANDAKVPVLSYCSSNPALTDAGDYIFRDYPSDNYQGVFAADYLYNKLGKKNVAVLYSKTDWANGIKPVFEQEFTKLGGQIVADEGFAQNATDVRTSIAKVKAANPDAIYFLGYTNETLVALKQAQEGGLNVSTWLGGDAWGDAKIWSSTGSYANNMMYLLVSSKPSESFIAAMQKKTGSNNINICTPTAYDGMKILAQVMSKAGDDRTAIKNELYNTTYTGGVSTDPIQFDQNGDLKTANYTVYQVKDGASAPLSN